MRDRMDREVLVLECFHRQLLFWERFALLAGRFVGKENYGFSSTPIFDRIVYLEREMKRLAVSKAVRVATSPLMISNGQVFIPSRALLAAFLKEAFGGALKPNASLNPTALSATYRSVSATPLS